jgi:hypothetical protein
MFLLIVTHHKHCLSMVSFGEILLSIMFTILVLVIVLMAATTSKWRKTMQERLGHRMDSLGEKLDPDGRFTNENLTKVANKARTSVANAISPPKPTVMERLKKSIV